MITIFSYILCIIIQYVVTVKKVLRYILIIIIIGSTVMQSLLILKQTLSASMSSVQGVRGFFRNLLFTNTYTGRFLIIYRYLISTYHLLQVYHFVLN